MGSRPLSPRLPAAVLGCCLLLPAAPAAAAGWSAPVRLDDQAAQSPAPHVAVSERGVVVAAWRDDRLRAKVAIRDRGGRFGAPQRLPRGADAARVAVAPDGRALAAWSQPGEVRIAFRRPGGRFGPSRRIARLEGQGVFTDLLVAIDARGDAVVAWQDFRRGRPRPTATVAVRAVAADGRLGPLQALSRGTYADMSGLAVNADGRAALVWAQAAGQAATTVHVALRPGRSAAFGPSQQVSGPAAADGRVAVDTLGTVAVAFTDVTTRGDAGARGVPVLRVMAAGASTFGPEARVPARFPNRFFGPDVVFSGTGRPMLVYQEKARPAPFSRDAPVKAALLVAGGVLQPAVTVARGPATRPLTAGLRSGRVLVLWSEGAWRAARSGSSGGFAATAAPEGRPLRFSDAGGNRDFAAAGPYAAAVWAQGDELRVSVRRF